MITIIIDNNNSKYEFNNTDTLLEVKNEIIKTSNIKSEYIDLYFNITKPIRILGKFNIEPGLVPRTLDRYCLDRFAFSQNKEIHVLYKECDNYVKPKPINKLDGKYIPPNLRSIAAVERPREVSWKPSWRSRLGCRKTCWMRRARWGLSFLMAT